MNILTRGGLKRALDLAGAKQRAKARGNGDAKVEDAVSAECQVGRCLECHG